MQKNSNCTRKKKKPEKRCSRCNEKKSIDEFKKDCSRPDGLHPYCKECVRVRRKELRHKKNSVALEGCRRRNREQYLRKIGKGNDQFDVYTKDFISRGLNEARRKLAELEKTKWNIKRRTSMTDQARQNALEEIERKIAMAKASGRNITPESLLNDFYKGKRSIIGEVKVFAGDKYIKEPDGWRRLSARELGEEDSKTKKVTTQSQAEKKRKEVQQAHQRPEKETRESQESRSSSSKKKTTTGDPKQDEVNEMALKNAKKGIAHVQNVTDFSNPKAVKQNLTAIRNLLGEVPNVEEEVEKAESYFSKEIGKLKRKFSASGDKEKSKTMADLQEWVKSKKKD